MNKTTETTTPKAELAAANDVAAMVRRRIPDWTEETPEPLLWRWTDRDEDYERTVTVDGRERIMRTVPEMAGQRFGPSLVGICGGVVVTVDLPSLVDITDMRSALRALTAVGALPDERKGRTGD